MTVVVLLRAVRDPELERGVTGSEWRLDDPSLAAIELATRLRRSGHQEVLAGVAVGPQEWDVALREALALGLDSLSRTWSESVMEADVPGHAEALAAAVGPETSLVIAGRAASDHGSGLLPAALAEMLDRELVEDVIGASAADAGLTVTLAQAGGRRLTCRVALPAVLVAAPIAGKRAYPAVARRLAARRATIAVGEPAVRRATRRIRVEGFGPARPVTRHLLKPAATANAGGRLRSLMSGGASSGGGGGGKTLQAGGDMASQLADLLVREGFGGVSRE